MSTNPTTKQQSINKQINQIETIKPAETLAPFSLFLPGLQANQTWENDNHVYNNIKQKNMKETQKLPNQSSDDQF